MPGLHSSSPAPTMAGQWRSNEEGTLPSFYSPRTTAHHDTSIEDDEVPAAPLEDNDDTTTNPDQDETALIQPPPPSLLSPSFTPPSTPGASTPPTSVSSLTGAPTTTTNTTSETRPARAIPVDSSLPDSASNCGPHRPKLVSRLPQVECIVRARIPTVSGTEMFLHLYTNDVDNKEHLAIVFGENIRSQSLDAPRLGETETDRMVRGAYVGRLFPGRTTSGMMGGAEVEASAEGARKMGKGSGADDIPLVRIHSECYTGETAWSARCDCGEQLDEAARLMSLPSNKAGGIIIYLRQEGRGIGLGEKLKAYNLQDLGSDTVEANLLLRHPADARSYGLATAMLLDLGQKEIRLLTNNPDKIRAVEGPNREVVVKERVEMVPLSWRGRGGFRSKEVEGYLKTKVSYHGREGVLGHMLTIHCRLRRWDTCWTWTRYPVNSPLHQIYKRFSSIFAGRLLVPDQFKPPKRRQSQFTIGRSLTADAWTALLRQCHPPVCIWVLHAASHAIGRQGQPCLHAHLEKTHHSPFLPTSIEVINY